MCFSLYFHLQIKESLEEMQINKGMSPCVRNGDFLTLEPSASIYYMKTINLCCLRAKSYITNSIAFIQQSISK